MKYCVWDCKEQRFVSGPLTRKGARRKAERLDLEYGAFRYTTRPVDNRSVDAPSGRPEPC